MKFRTEINLKDAPFLLNPERLVLLVGSCFADNIGRKIANAGWEAAVNPCGVVYNPASMALLFQLALTPRMSRRAILESSITSREGKYVSWFMDSKVAGNSPEEAADKAMEAVDSLEEAIEKAGALILTFGTSDVYLLKDRDCAVGNCHKHPAAEFEKKRLGIQEIVEIWKQLTAVMKERNPELKVVFTVSPRRYSADGFAENSRLKAILLLACEQLCRTEQDLCYFPAYEILNDDLRDYRFYAADMLHPSEQAVDYIWEKFLGYFLSPSSIDRIREGEKRIKALGHRPIL